MGHHVSVQRLIRNQQEQLAAAAVIVWISNKISIESLSFVLVMTALATLTRGGVSASPIIWLVACCKKGRLGGYIV